MQAVVLACDGCSTELGTDGQFRTAMDARAAAYAAGWRFVAKLKKDGQPAGGLSPTNTSDVCPKCLPTFRPQYRGEGVRTAYRAIGSDQ
jgi:hypothetical protein